jgi:hypothetical protein
MAIPYTQPSMALVRAVDGTYISYPFIESGDATTKVYNLVCTQRASDYNAAQIDLDDNMSSAANAGVIDLPSGWADSNAYFVGDTGHAPIGGGMISFTRTFCNIPQSTTISSGSAFVTFPGIVGFGSFGSSIGVSSVSYEAGTRGMKFTTGIAHNLSNNETVYLSMNYTAGGDPFINQVMGQFLAYDVTSNSVQIDVGQNWDNGTYIYASNVKLRKNDLIRDPISYNVSTQTRYDYILPGVTSWANDALDIQVTSPFYAVVASGEPTDSVHDTIFGDPILLATIPDATTYVNMVKNEHHLVIESSLSEWAGNILVQKTKTCKAR